MGRPNTFDQTIVDEVCLRIAQGETLRAVLRSDAKFPPIGTFLRWVIRDEPKGIAEQYARARESCIHVMIDETFAIADDSSNDTIVKTGHGGEEYEAPNNEWIQRSRLRVDTRKWLASKICPKLYGDKVTTEVTGANGGPLNITWNPPQG